jgi:magnesium chelatase accessory protein
MQRLPGFTRWAAQAASRPAAVQRLVASTGSRLQASQLAHYRELLQAPEHLHGALDMMAGWDVAPLLPALRTRLAQQPLALRLAAGGADATVPASQSRRLAVELPGAEFVLLPGLGHLAHEEEAGLVGQLAAGLAIGR